MEAEKKQILIRLTAIADNVLRKDVRKKGDLTKKLKYCIEKGLPEIETIDLYFRKPGKKNTGDITNFYFTTLNLETAIADRLEEVARNRLTCKSVLIESFLLKYG